MPTASRAGVVFYLLAPLLRISQLNVIRAQGSVQRLAPLASFVAHEKKYLDTKRAAISCITVKTAFERQSTLLTCYGGERHKCYIKN